MDNYSTRHSKARPLTKPNFYHSSTYGGINYRQNDYSFASSTRTSGLLWHDSKQLPKVESSRSKGKYCSIALAAATLLVLVAVLAIAGLALYMGALRSEPPSPLITFLCRAKVVRGDRFIIGLADKARRYRMQFENMYQRSTLGPSFVSCSVDTFGNDTRTIFFRITLNRRKIPRHVLNVEKTLKDILLTDAINRKPIFPGIQFEAKTLTIKRMDGGDASQRAKAPKETVKRPAQSSGVLTRNATPAVRRPATQDMKDATTVQGMFKISKTDADITEVHASSIRTPMVEVPLPAAPSSPSPVSSVSGKLKETYVTSALFKLATGSTQRTTKMAIVSTTSRPLPIPSKPSSSSISTANPTTIKSSNISLPNPYYFNPSIYSQEPWVPIFHQTEVATTLTPESLDSVASKPLNSSVNEDRPQKEVIYTSFTNQGLSWQSTDQETLGSTKLKGHPLPVNKIGEVTDPIETIFFTTPYSINFETEFRQDSIGQAIENREGSELEMEDSTIASDDDLLSNKNASSSTSSTTEALSTLLPNVGKAEVIAVDDVPFVHATKMPSVVTLLPVKSNSGVGRPVRPRPNRLNHTETHDLAHTSESTDNYHTEVVTSVSLQETRVKTNKNQLNDFHIVSVLNFATEIPTLTSETSESLSEEAQPSQLEGPAVKQQILTPEQLAELSKISNVNVNSTNMHSNVISTKAIAGSHHNGFELLTKTFSQVPNGATNLNAKEHIGYNKLHTVSVNASACSNFTLQCGNGQCLSNSTRCNSMIDCSDGSDEQDCTCADYLRSQFLIKKICDGIVDCWDFSDENNCDWCEPGQYVCANSKQCINRKKICDGLTDCPHGDDERQCVTVAPDLATAEGFSYNSDGYLMVRKSGFWGKLCVDNFKRVISTSKVNWEVADLGQAVCKALTYQKLKSTDIIQEKLVSANYEKTPYYELAFQANNGTKSNLSFQRTACDSREVVVVKCQSLECGTRTQMEKKSNARIVGGGNAGLGAWPWQVGLYKEGEFQCGGTLISERWILSAGHCFYHSFKDHWVARLGNLRRSTSFSSPYEQHRAIVSINLHPGYIDLGFINDISLLEMQLPVVFSDYVRPICLPQSGLIPSDGKMCTVIGWGQLLEIGRIFPDTLQEVQLPIISSAECRKRTIFLPLYQVTDNMLCAGYDRGGRDACLGDSGGPLMCAEEDGRWVLHGITSNGYGCARAFRPGVYTKVANYVNWIQLHMNSNTTESLEATGNGTLLDTCTGHRCPLGECLAKSRICNGYIECSDGSDERACSKS